MDTENGGLHPSSAVTRSTLFVSAVGARRSGVGCFGGRFPIAAQTKRRSAISAAIARPLSPGARNSNTIFPS